LFQSQVPCFCSGSQPLLEETPLAVQDCLPVVEKTVLHLLTALCQARSRFRSFQKFPPTVLQIIGMTLVVLSDLTFYRLLLHSLLSAICQLFFFVDDPPLPSGLGFRRRDGFLCPPKISSPSPDPNSPLHSVAVLVCLPNALPFPS